MASCRPGHGRCDQSGTRRHRARAGGAPWEGRPGGQPAAQGLWPLAVVVPCPGGGTTAELPVEHAGPAGAAAAAGAERGTAGAGGQGAEVRAREPVFRRCLMMSKGILVDFGGCSSGLNIMF